MPTPPKTVIMKTKECEFNIELAAAAEEGDLLKVIALADKVTDPVWQYRASNYGKWLGRVNVFLAASKHLETFAWLVNYYRPKARLLREAVRRNPELTEFVKQYAKQKDEEDKKCAIKS